MKSNKQGFTIIEVVLVLAIAGLIFLMIFIALPAMQRGQRDNGRKNDVSIVAAAINNYRTNNRVLTNMKSADLTKYIDKLDQYDKSSQVMVVSSDRAEVPADKIIVRVGAVCPDILPAPGTTSIKFKKQSSSTAAVAALLENNGSQKQVFCASS
ncbi:MAG: type II secretion system protein [Candidatus Saccharibacteria bacterium]|nr:type II secretion system protein [Candidatus Saccharibacteria bacterium]